MRLHLLEPLVATVRSLGVGPAALATDGGPGCSTTGTGTSPIAVT